MGIVVEFDRSKATFEGPAPGDIGITDNRRGFGYDMYSFDIQFGIKFDPDSNIGLGGNPPSEQSWRIGIIQNVLQERLFFEYEELTANPSKKTFEKVFRLAETDVVANAKSFPFYDDQKTQPGGSLVRRPSADVAYSSKGYRDKSAKPSVFDNTPSTFTMWDQPSGFGRLAKDNTFWLKRIEKVIFFQAWLVVIKEGDFSLVTSPLDRIRKDFIPEIIRDSRTNVLPLAHIPPFGMTFWAQANLASFRPRLSIDTPDYTWGLASVDGFFPTKKINTLTRGVTGIARVAKAAPGNGGRDPVWTGSTANQAATSWLKSQGLD